MSEKYCSECTFTSCKDGCKTAMDIVTDLERKIENISVRLDLDPYDNSTIEDAIDKLKAQNISMKNFINNLSNSILNEIEEDGYCRLVVDKNTVLEAQKALLEEVDYDEKLRE